MAWLDTLLPLILLALYFLTQLRRGDKGKRRTPTPSDPLTTRDVEGESDQSASAPTPFELLVRQIQEAAQEAQRAQAPPPPDPAPPPPPARRTLRPPASVEPREFESLGGFEHERHGFGLDNPFSEEAFERLPRGADVTEHAPGHLDHDPHAPRGRRRSPRRPARKGHPLAARLRETGDARDAFALREILDAPLARRRRR